ncbi:unnamed protein product [Clavelina lepadiformis]|uniref:Uncharacterized protein n=1 Tax=Clavelina lepadiformis TaxID=159417 RepID=A0ABP0GUQ3_CLALP
MTGSVAGQGELFEKRTIVKGHGDESSRDDATVSSGDQCLQAAEIYLRMKMKKLKNHFAANRVTRLNEFRLETNLFNFTDERLSELCHGYSDHQENILLGF